MEEKKCKKCNSLKPIEDFNKNKKQEDGLDKMCKSCSRLESKKYYEKNREKELTRLKIYRENNKEIVKKRMLKHNLKNNNINISIEEYYEIFSKHNGKCDICKRPQSELKKTFAVDHDHITGEIRGLLCSNCNLGLGNFKDDINILTNAIKYLKK
jgi:hypothetical protein